MGYGDAGKGAGGVQEGCRAWYLHPPADPARPSRL